MKERLVTSNPFDETLALDGVVGPLDCLEETSPFARPDDVPIRISVAGDGPSGPNAMGLAEDLALLAREFVQRRAPSGEQRSRAAEPAPADTDGEVEIALHGVELDPEAKKELHRLIRELVRERTAGGEEAK
jgi:hypothetical protein